MKYLVVIILLHFLILSNGILHAQWMQTNGPYSGYSGSLTVHGTNIFAIDGYYIFLSTNNGTNWTPVMNGVFSNSNFLSLATSSNRIFAGTSNIGVYMSTNDGTLWIPVLQGFNTADRVNSLAGSGSYIYAGTSGGVYIALNNGSNWTKVNNGLTNTNIASIAASGNNIFVGTFSGGVFFSANRGTNWTQVNNGLTSLNVCSFAFNGTNIFAGTVGGGIFYSTDNGTNWIQTNNGLTNNNVYALSISGTNIFAGTHGGVFLSTDNGANWSQVNDGLTNTIVNSIAVSGSYLYTGTGDYYNTNGVFVSTNNGTFWTQSGLPTIRVCSLAFKGTDLIAGTYTDGIYSSSNNGIDWTKLISIPYISVFSLAVSGTNLFAGTEGDGVYLWDGISWTQVNNGLVGYNVFSLAVSGSNIFAGTNNHVCLSTDNGTIWNDMLWTGNNVQSLLINRSNIFAGTSGGGVYLSTDNGTTWTQINNGLSNSVITSIAAIGTNIFAGTSSGVFLSTDNGANWVQVNNGLTNINVRTLSVYGDNIFAGSGNGSAGGVFLSTNGGTNWTQVGLNNYYVRSFAIGGDNLFAGVDLAGVWTKSLSDLPLPVELSSFVSNVNGHNILLNWSTQTEKNSDKFEIERISKSGNWESIASIKAAVLSNSLKQYFYTDKNLQSGKYQYRLKMIDNDGTFEYSKIIESEVSTPKNFELTQNYPNPFNPYTKINYNLPFDSKVTLEVFNLTGEMIGLLVNDKQSAGYYSVDFNSSKLNKSIPSGVYFYRITAIDNVIGNNFSSIKKMILLK